MLLNTDTLRDFLEGSLPAVSALCADLSYIGLEVESAIPFDLPDLVVVGQVLECAKHPDATKLHVCQVDMGSEVLQIVCGAGNVGVGQFVAVALQGAYLPTCNLSIQASHLRGVQSLGMLCSAVELGLPKTNEGILILDSSINHDKPLKLGMPLKDLPFFKGTLLDIAITPNRGDCLSVLGLAREISALYHLPLKSPHKLAIGAPLDIQIAPNLPPCVLNYALLDLKPSMPLEIALSLALQHNLQPDPLANFLEYATYLSGVLLHAYPHVRLEVGINAAGFVCVGDHAQTLSVLGISPPKPTSAPYLIEASFIDPEHLCQSLHAHPMEHSPTLTHRSKRGSDPQVLAGLEWLAFLLQRFAPQANLQVSPPSTPALPAKTLNFSPQDIGDILGQTPSKERIQEILKALRFELCDQGDQFLATIPPFRHDISTIPDIAEEILRIQGLDDLPKSSLATFEPSSANPHYTRHLFERQIATKALAWGFKEVVHYLFAKKEHLETLGYPTLQENLDLLNPINSDLNTLRTSLIPGLLEALGRNKNWGFKSVALFELGSVYDIQRTQQSSLAFLAAGLQTLPHYPNPKGTEWDFYSFTAMLARILGVFELHPISPQQRQDQPYLNTTYHPYQSAWIFQEGVKIGVVGALNPILVQEHDLLEGFIAEVFSAHLNPKAHKTQEFSKLPTSFRDLTILVGKELPFSDLKKSIQQAQIPYLKEVFALDVYPQSPQEIALSLRLKIQSQESLIDSQLQEVVDRVLHILNTHFKAKLKWSQSSQPRVLISASINSPPINPWVTAPLYWLC